MSNQSIDLKHSNLADFIETSLVKYADKPAYSCLGQTLSFADIDEKSKAFACFLQQHPKLKEGDRVAIQQPNLLQYPIAAYGALRAGMVLVNTNPLYTPREMQHQFKDSGAKAVVILTDLLPKLEEVKEETDLEVVISTAATDLLTDNFDNAPEACVAFNQILHEYRVEQLQARSATQGDDICILQYTGGTTGVSKGACLSHTNVIANAQQTLERVGAGCQEAEEIFVCPLPLYHIYAFTLNMVMFACNGNQNILIPISRAMKSWGIDYSEALDNCGIKPQDFRHHESRLSAEKISQLVTYCNKDKNRQDFAIAMAEHFYIGMFHALGYAMMASDSLYDALSRIAKYKKVVSNTCTLELIKQDNSTLVRME